MRLALALLVAFGALVITAGAIDAVNYHRVGTGAAAGPDACRLLYWHTGELHGPAAAEQAEAKCRATK